MLNAAAEINHHSRAKGDIAMWTASRRRRRRRRRRADQRPGKRIKGKK